MKISRVVRFFCKTYPKDKKDTIIKAKENVFFPNPEVNEFDHIIKSFKDKANPKKSSKKTVKTITTTKYESVSAARKSRPRFAKAKYESVSAARKSNSPRRSSRQAKEPAANTTPAKDAKRKPPPKEATKTPTKDAKRKRNQSIDLVTPVKGKGEGSKKVNIKTPDKSSATKKIKMQRNVKKTRTKTEGGVGISLEHKNLISRNRARVHEIQPSSLKKREYRESDHMDAVNSRITCPEFMTYMPTPLESTRMIDVNSTSLISKTFSRMKVEAHGLSKYFELNRLEEEYENLEESGFRKLIEKLWTVMQQEIKTHQRAWIFDVNHKTQTYGKCYEWMYCFPFTNWWKCEENENDDKKKEETTDGTKQKSADKTNPQTEWLFLTEMDGEGKIGVISRRVFVKDEVVGVYFGKLPTIDEYSKYAINTPYGVFDPARGHTKCGGKPCYFMALHEARVASSEELANTVLLKNLLVKATTNIEIGDEIVIRYDNGVTSAYISK
jgi:hypothetical protein